MTSDAIGAVFLVTISVAAAGLVLAGLNPPDPQPTDVAPTWIPYSPSERANVTGYLMEVDHLYGPEEATIGIYTNATLHEVTINRTSRVFIPCPALEDGARLIADDEVAAYSTMPACGHLDWQPSDDEDAIDLDPGDGEDPTDPPPPTSCEDTLTTICYYG